jgi:hypothetical protein
VISDDDKRNSLELLEKTAGMTANQRLIVMLYALHPTGRSGAVLETAANLAALVGMAPPVFSRTRKQVIAAGWLEEAERVGHIKYYRLARSMGENTVAPLRRAM